MMSELSRKDKITCDRYSLFQKASNGQWPMGRVLNYALYNYFGQARETHLTFHKRWKAHNETLFGLKHGTKEIKSKKPIGKTHYLDHYGSLRQTLCSW